MIGKMMRFLRLKPQLDRGKMMEDAKAQQPLRKAIGACPACGGALDGHRYKLVASVVLDPDSGDAAARLLAALKNHDWGNVVGFQEWKGDSNNAEVYLLACPSGVLSIVEIASPVEIWASGYVIHTERVEEPALFPETTFQGETWREFR
jgi:hypothetical protein